MMDRIHCPMRISSAELDIGTQPAANLPMDPLSEQPRQFPSLVVFAGAGVRAPAGSAASAASISAQVGARQR